MTIGKLLANFFLGFRVSKSNEENNNRCLWLLLYYSSLTYYLPLREDTMYSHKAASKTAIDRLERSIEVMGTMPEQIAEAHVRFMGYDLPDNCSAAVKRGRLLKLLSDEVLREAKRAEREEFTTQAKAQNFGDGNDDDDDDENTKNVSSSRRQQNDNLSSSSISSNRRICDDAGDNNSTETKIVNGGGRYNNNNEGSDSDSDSSVQGTERAAPPPRSLSPPPPRVDEREANTASTNTYADSESEASEEDPDNYYGKAALEPEAPPGSNPFATITSEKQKEMEKEALQQIEEAKKMMAALKFNVSKNDNSNTNSSDDEDDNDDNDSIDNISNNDNNKNDDENIPNGDLLAGESFAQHQNSKFKNVSFPPLPIEDDVRSIRSDAVSSRGGDDVGSVKDFGGSEYGGSIYSVAATMGSNQNEQEDDEKLLDQLVEEAEVERILRGRIDEEEGDGNIIDDNSEGKENEVHLSL